MVLLHDRTCTYSDINLARKTDPSKKYFKPWNRNWIELLTIEDTVMRCSTRHYAITMSWWCLENDGQHFLKLPSPDIKVSLVGAKSLE